MRHVSGALFRFRRHKRLHWMSFNGYILLPKNSNDYMQLSWGRFQPANANRHGQLKDLFMTPWSARTLLLALLIFPGVGGAEQAASGVAKIRIGGTGAPRRAGLGQVRA